MWYPLSVSKGISSCNLSVSVFENAPQAITSLSKTNLCVSDLITGFFSSKFKSLIFNFKNFPPF